ncbi:hypothetical protein [Sinosporangium album]|uniref:hypothetical protein n=1 Tax=Sinosporangium album TaxID=504805 RepID=UPI000B82A8C6|nr:hypothetical protein [Sinosporangium album]
MSVQIPALNAPPLEGLRHAALRDRFAAGPRPPVPILDALLEPHREGTNPLIVSQFSPRNAKSRLSD